MKNLLASVAPRNFILGMVMAILMGFIDKIKSPILKEGAELFARIFEAVFNVFTDDDQDNERQLKEVLKKFLTPLLEWATRLLWSIIDEEGSISQKLDRQLVKESLDLSPTLARAYLEGNDEALKKNLMACDLPEIKEG